MQATRSHKDWLTQVIILLRAPWSDRIPTHESMPETMENYHGYT